MLSVFLNHTLLIGCLFLGTFGRIFHGILIEEKDPSKEKQVFVKTVKGMFVKGAGLCAGV